MKVALYSHPEFDLVLEVVRDATGLFVAAALFGDGFDGRSFRALIGDDGAVRMLKDPAANDAREWPKKDRDDDLAVVGKASVSVDDAHATLTGSINRFALGYPRVDFSPTPPDDVDVSLTFDRLA